MDAEQLPRLTIDAPGLFSRLQAGHVLVTGNNRLARHLANGYAQFRKGRGDRQWRTPCVLPWGAWLEGCWESASLAGLANTEGRVPGPRQVLRLWERVLRDSQGSLGTVLPNSLAVDLRDTRALVVEWELDLGRPEWRGGHNENHAAFTRWNRAFERRCQQDQWIPPEDRLRRLSDGLALGQAVIAGPIDFIGFDELSPARRRLLQALADSGVECRLLETGAANATGCRWTATDQEDEYRHMAGWVRHWLETDPSARIGIVVNDLPKERASIERHLSKALVPAEPDNPGTARPWNISAGLPLSRYPMIVAALDWLDMAQPKLDIGLVSRVLRTPWIRGGDSERTGRALLERCLRKKHPRHLRLGDLRYRAGERGRPDADAQDEQPVTPPRPWNCPELSKLLARLEQESTDRSEALSPSAWAERLDGMLRAAGWPQISGPANDGANDEWQTLEAWRDCLMELASLDAVESAWRRPEAVSQLRRICEDRVFQPRGARAPVQVLGLYEAHSMQFDHLWVSGLHNENWPPAAQPNPFIPGKLQVENALPHSSPQRELDVARTITRRLLQSAEDCLFSHTGQVDGEDVLASPLLAELDEIDEEKIPASKTPTWTQLMLQDPGPSTVVAASPGRLSLDDGPEQAARGGSNILKHQALCPFRAFAANRLLAEPLESPAAGIDSRLHGSLLHRTLESFWNDVGSHAELAGMDSPALASRVESHVQETLDKVPGLKFRRALRAVEAARLSRHVLDYLELEKDREPFTVADVERKLTLEIHGLPIRISIDRVDRLADGDEIILDYKTGKVHPGKWFSSRPEEPQLPLYALSTSDPPAAVAFAVIREDGCEFKGLSQREGILPGLPPRRTKATEYLVDAGEAMPETIAAWRKTLHALVADFLAGKAEVDPLNERRTCRETWCQFQALCRIDELDPAHAVDEGDEE